MVRWSWVVAAQFRLRLSCLGRSRAGGTNTAPPGEQGATLALCGGALETAATSATTCAPLCLSCLWKGQSLWWTFKILGCETRLVRSYIALHTMCTYTENQEWTCHHSFTICLLRCASVILISTSSNKINKVSNYICRYNTYKIKFVYVRLWPKWT